MANRVSITIAAATATLLLVLNTPFAHAHSAQIAPQSSRVNIEDIEEPAAN